MVSNPQQVLATMSPVMVAALPTDELQHIGDVMHAAAHTHRKDTP